MVFTRPQGQHMFSSHQAMLVEELPAQIQPAYALDFTCRNSDLQISAAASECFVVPHSSTSVGFGASSWSVECPVRQWTWF